MSAATQTVPVAFAEGVRRLPDQSMSWVRGPARVDASFAAVGEAVSHVAAALVELGLAPGSVVVSTLPNRREGMVLLHAALRAGLVLAPVLPTLGTRELQSAISDTRAVAFVAENIGDADTWFSSVSAHGPVDRATRLIAADTAGPGVLRWSDLESTEAAFDVHAASDRRRGPDDTAAVLFTSGSTGRPKGVVHTHRSLLACAAIGIPGAGADAHTELSVLPSGHVGGVIRSVRAFILGTRVVYLDGWDADRALDLIEAESVTSAAFTPFFLTELIRHQRARPRHTATLTHILAGGAAVPPSLIEAAEDMGWTAVKGYGSTEHPNSFFACVDDPLDHRARTCGSAGPGVRARIVRSDGSDADTGGEGELQVQGPSQSVGYLDSADTSAAFADGGWFRTGDLARFDDDGLLRITGRVKDVIIRGGENISAVEVENLLVADDRVREAAVVGYPDERYGERVCAFLVVEAGSEMDLHEVRSHFRSMGVDVRKTPERVIIVDELPRTGPGKVAKVELRTRVLADLGLAAGNVSSDAR